VLDPGYALGHHRYGLYLLYQGRLDEAQAVLERAVALDPLYASVNMNLARLHLRARRPNEAIPLLRTALELSPGLALAHEHLGHAYLQNGKQRAAISAFQRAAALSGPRGSAQLAYALAVTGKRTEAEDVLRQLLDQSQHQFIPPVAVAMAHVGLGDADAAFQWLDRGYADHAAFMDGLKATPAFDPLHADVRWAQLLNRMGLKP
jgi:tetratricopeptide (TPR) repeat protein